MWFYGTQSKSVSSCLEVTMSVLSTYWEGHVFKICFGKRWKMYHLKVERNTKEINFGVIKIISAQGDDCHELALSQALKRENSNF